MKVLVADDHAIVRAGLTEIISEIDGITQIDEAENGEDVISMVDDNNYNLIVLDISMPKRSGIEVLLQLKKTNNKTPILILSLYPEGQYGKKILQAGASGFIEKHAEPDELKNAILKILKGGKYISQQLAAQLADDIFNKSESSLHDLLSLREFEVMRLIALGKTTKQIAEEMCLSSKTISTYRSRIIEKTKLNNNTEITKYCITKGLV